MNRRARFGWVGMSGLITVMLFGVLPAQEPIAPAPGTGLPAAPPPPGTDNLVLIGHALSMAISGTSMHLAARHLAAAPERKGEEAKGALEQLRTQARKAYENSQLLFQEARQKVAGHSADQLDRQVYDAAVAYTKTMWALAGQAAPVDRPKAEAEVTGQLNVADEASMEVINHAVMEGLQAYTLRQLTMRMPGTPTVIELEKHSGKMASAAKKASVKFPGVAREQLEQATKKLEVATAKLEVAKATLKVAEQEQKSPVDDIAKGIAKIAEQKAKMEKKAAKKAKEAAEEAQIKAKAAVEADVGAGVNPTIETLAEQGRLLILLTGPGIESPAESVARKVQEKKEVLTPKEALKKVEKATKKAETEKKEAEKRLRKLESQP